MIIRIGITCGWVSCAHQYRRWKSGDAAHSNHTGGESTDRDEKKVEQRKTQIKKIHRYYLLLKYWAIAMAAAGVQKPLPVSEAFDIMPLQVTEPRQASPQKQ
jgi:hypothetical protein